VNAILATLGWVTSASPISPPKPVTMLTTPGGNPTSSNRRPNSSAETDENSDGFHTAVLPAASAGASFQAASSRSEFQGVIAATTPSGSSRVKLNTPGLSIGITRPSSLSARPPK
jgi:hypothetical protein